MENETVERMNDSVAVWCRRSDSKIADFNKSCIHQCSLVEDVSWLILQFKELQLLQSMFQSSRVIESN
jgi:hypothetical protein